MRWAVPIVFSLFRRRRFQNCFHFYRSLSHELSLSDQVLAMLHTLPPSSLEPSLDVLAPLLTPHVISSVLSHSNSSFNSLPFHSAFRFFVWASSHKRLRSWHSLNLVVSSLRHDNLASSWDLLQEIKNSGRPVAPPAFIALIRAYSDSGTPEKALHAFTCMPNFACRPDTFTYNTVLNILVKKDGIFIAMKLYHQMLELGCLPNRATFGILIDGLCKAGLIDDANNLFAEMAQSGIAPNAMIYTLLLSAHCNKMQMGEAEKLLDSMRENNCGPDSVAYGVMLDGYCKSGKVDLAFEQLRVFREEGYVLDLSGYSCLIAGLFRSKRFEDACRLYQEMLERNLEPDCVLYTIMIRGFSEKGRVEEASMVLREMADRGMVPDTYCYNTLIKGLCDAGRLDQARSLRLEISQHDLFPDSATYTIMICGLCKEGLVHEAQHIFDEMGKLGCVPTVNTFNSLISGLCRAGKLEEAHSLFNKMNIKPSLFLRLSQGFNHVRDKGHLRKMVEQLCEAGLVVKAYKLLRDTIDGVTPDVVTYNILINGLFKAGKPNEALNLYKELKIMDHSPDEVTLGTLIDGLSKVHREEDAWTLFQDAFKDGGSPSPEICNTLMRTMCRKKRVSQAVSLWLTHITQWRTSPEEAETIKVMKNHFEQGRLIETVKGLIEMDHKGGSVNSFPYTIWLIGFCQARKVDEALKIFTILTEFDIEVTPPSCVLLIHSLCWEGKLTPALDVMLYALRRGFSLNQTVGNRLLKNLCMGNKKKEAHELVWRMSLAGYDMDIYLRAATKQLLYNQMTGVS